MSTRFCLTARHFAIAAVVSATMLAADSVSVDGDLQGDALQVGCESEHRSLIGNVDELTFEIESSTNTGRHSARFQLAGESFTLTLSRADDMADATVSLEYTDGFRKIATRVRVADIEGADGWVLSAFLSESDGALLRGIRESALRQMLRRGDDPVIQTFLQLQVAVVNTGSGSGGVYVQPFNILECGPYAACYWGCVAGGGGFYDCGPHCNGGGPGGSCY